jgi:hypothetical protein
MQADVAALATEGAGTWVAAGDGVEAGGVPQAASRAAARVAKRVEDGWNIVHSLLRWMGECTVVRHRHGGQQLATSARTVA